MQLRLAGLSRSQIVDAPGLASGGEPLPTWLKDVPAPAWTAGREPRTTCGKIRETVGVAKSTLSLWLRDVPLTEDQPRALDLRGPAATGKNSEAERADATRRRSIVQAQAKAQITPERE